MMSFESSSLCEISPKYFFHSRMKRGGRLSGPKRSTQRKGKEYKTMRRAQLAEFVAKKRGQGGRAALNNEGSSSSDRGVQEEVRDAYSEPAYRQGDFVIILKDTSGTKSIFLGAYGVPETFVIDRELNILRKYIGPINFENEIEIKQLVK